MNKLVTLLVCFLSLIVPTIQNLIKNPTFHPIKFTGPDLYPALEVPPWKALVRHSLFISTWINEHYPHILNMTVLVLDLDHSQTIQQNLILQKGFYSLSVLAAAVNIKKTISFRFTFCTETCFLFFDKQSVDPIFKQVCNIQINSKTSCFIKIHQEKISNKSRVTIFLSQVTVVKTKNSMHSHLNQNDKEQLA